jgi:hypothetical protein
MHAGLPMEPGEAGEVGWIGAPPSPVAITAVLVVGTVGMLICGVQPVLLGALLAEHRLSSAELGLTTTAEFLSLGIAMGLAGAFLQPRRLRAKMAVAALVALVADLLVAREAGVSLLLNRAVAGLAEGLLVWCAGCMIARSAAPARWAAIFLTIQNLSQLVFAAAAPVTVMKLGGADAGFLALGATAILALAATPFLPSALADLPAPPKGEPGGGKAYSARALASLVSVFLIAAFSIGLFAYLAPLAAQAHIDTKGLGLLVSIVLATQTLGSALAAVVANRVRYYTVFVICVVANAVILAMLAVLPGFPLFALATGLFGFFWLFFLPFQLPFVIESDPTRRIAVITPSAQLLGGAAGPLLCSFFVTDADSTGALVVCGVCFAAAFVISTALHIHHLRSLRAARLAPSA